VDTSDRSDFVETALASLAWRALAALQLYLEWKYGIAPLELEPELQRGWWHMRLHQPVHPSQQPHLSVGNFAGGGGIPGYQDESQPTAAVAFMQATASRQFLLFLETLTGIKGLIPDPYYIGGGAMTAGDGDKLDISVVERHQFDTFYHEHLLELPTVSPAAASRSPQPGH
jgi:hypothetical protein